MNNKGHVRERSKGHWYVIVSEADPKTSKRKRKWISLPGAKTKREANTAAVQVLANIDKGEHQEPSKTTMAQYLERWLEHIKRQVSPKTHERYSELVRKNLTPLLGDRLVTKLTAPHVDAAYSTALTSGRRDGSGGLSPRTVHHLHRVLKQALTQAVRWQIITRNPADAATPPKVERKTIETYNMGQTADVIGVMRETRMFAPALLALLCGLRRGEIAALRWSAVNLDTSQLSVVQSAEQTGKVIRYKTPKSGHGRTVALSSFVVDELKTIRKLQAEMLLKLGIRLSDETFVCAHADGTPLQPTFITHEWVRLIGSSDLARYRFHDLRHAHATHLLSSGVHPKVASERLGHSKVGITLDLYSHVLPGMQEDAAARVDQALRKAIAQKTKG